MESGSSYVPEYQIDLASYFRLSDTTIDESSPATINNIGNDVCEFTLQGSGLEDNEIKVVVSIRAAIKIYKHTERTSAMLTIKEIQIPSTTDSKDAGLMTSVLSFEPSGVVFSEDSMDGEVSSGDFITVTTPTLMTWDANWTLNADEVSDALKHLRVVWKENEGDDVWQTCQYGKDFNGIIDINKKKADTRIIATYALNHFCLFSLMGGFFRKQVYALCAMSEDDRNSETYSIQCSICYENPKRRGWLGGDLCYSINDDCFIASEIIHFDGDLDNLIPVEFIFNEYQSSDHNYHLKPFQIDSRTVFVREIEWKYEYIPKCTKQNCFYHLIKGNHDEGIRTRVKVETNKNKDTKRNELKICGVYSVILLSLYFIVSTSVFI